MARIYKVVNGSRRQIGGIHYNENDAVDSAKLHVADFRESVEVLSADVGEGAGVPLGVLDWTIIKVVWV